MDQLFTEVEAGRMSVNELEKRLQRYQEDTEKGGEAVAWTAAGFIPAVGPVARIGKAATMGGKAAQVAVEVVRTSTMAGALTPAIETADALTSNSKTYSPGKAGKDALKAAGTTALGGTLLAGGAQTFRRAVQFPAWGRELAGQFTDAFPAVRQQMNGTFETFGAVSLRPKSAQSITDKLARRTNKGESITNLTTAANTVEDGVGSRLVLSDASKKGAQAVVERLQQAIRNREMTITRIENYRGPEGHPYFSDEQIQLLEQAALESGGPGITVVEKNQLTKSSGYTTTQMDVVYQNGITGEFQIRGAQVNEVSEVEHVLYDLREGKKLDPIFDPIKQTLSSLTSAEQESLKRYLQAEYQHARLVELGQPSTAPRIDDFGLANRQDLSIEKISPLVEQYHAQKAAEAAASP